MRGSDILHFKSVSRRVFATHIKPRACCPNGKLRQFLKLESLYLFFFLLSLVYRVFQLVRCLYHKHFVPKFFFVSLFF